MPRSGVVRIRYSLRFLLVVVTLVCVAFAWATARVARQRTAEAAVEKTGGRAVYDDVLIEGRIHWMTADSFQIVEEYEPSWFEASVDGLIGPELLHDIVYVDFFNAEATDQAMLALGQLHALQGISVRSSPVSDEVGTVAVTDESLDAIARLPKLIYLDLGNSRVTDAGMRHIARFPALRYLGLSFTNIGDDGVKEVAKLRSLNMLGLTGTKITDQSLRLLQQSKHLKHLYVFETAVTIRGIEEFQAAVPGCMVYYEGFTMGATDGQRGPPSFVSPVRTMWTNVECPLYLSGIMQCQHCPH